MVLAGVAVGFDTTAELKPVEGVQEYEIDPVPLFVTDDPSEADPAAQIVTPPPEMEATGTLLVIPVKTIPVPVLLAAVDVKVFEPITPYFTHGKLPIYLAAAMVDSVPAISAAR